MREPAEPLPWPDYADVADVVRAAAARAASATVTIELDAFGDDWILRRERLTVEAGDGRVQAPDGSLAQLLAQRLRSEPLIVRPAAHAGDVAVGEGLVLRGLNTTTRNDISTRLRRLHAAPGPVRRVAPSCDYDAGIQPKIIKVEPTTYCNLRCGFCTNPSLTKRSHLPLSSFARLWSSVDPSQIEKVSFTGLGESMLHPELWAMIDLVVRTGVTTSLVSNGTMIARFAEQIVESGLHHLALSIETTDPEKFAAQRVGLELPQLLSNLDTLLAVVERRGSPLQIHVLCVLIDEDGEDWRSLIALCRSRGLSPPRFYPQYVRHLAGDTDGHAAARRLDTRFRAIERSIRESFDGDTAELPREVLLLRGDAHAEAPPGPRCREATTTLLLRADGTWSYCNEGIFHAGPIDAGRVDDYPDIAKIWASPARRRHRLALELGVIPPLCHGCPVIDLPKVIRRLPMIRSTSAPL